MASLEVRKVSKKFGSLAALSEVSLAVDDGEFLVLLGPSGCGKSTLLNMIAGLEPVTAGDILIDGRVVNEFAPKDRDIAMVFQSYALYPSMNVYENMSFGMRVRRVPKAARDAEVRRVAALLQLDTLLHRRPHQLSGGQRQRVAMGRALVRNPKVFLFDEPLSNLDAKLRVEMRTELKKLHQNLGVTIVYVTHDQIEAMTLATKVVVMKGGAVQQVGGAAGNLRPACQSVRRRVHRVAVDEPRPRCARAGRRARLRPYLTSPRGRHPPGHRTHCG